MHSQEGTKLCYQYTTPLLEAGVAIIFLFEVFDPNILPYANLKIIFKKEHQYWQSDFYAKSLQKLDQTAINGYYLQNETNFQIISFLLELFIVKYSLFL